MISKINFTEFKKRLDYNTKYGNPKIKGTPFGIFTVFGESNKLFFGTYNNVNFELTKNSTFFPTLFIISGKIISNKNNQTELTYEIKPIGFGYYWNKYMPIVGAVIFNLILFNISAPIEIYKIVNLAIFVIAFLNYFIMWRTKHKLVSHFERVFEIKV